jgi:succinyl-CoA synthetase alpha subunit
MKLSPEMGLLFYLIKNVRPELANRIRETKEIETMIIGLGKQGTRHTGLMMEYGTKITCGVAPGRGGTRVHETIPVYNNSAEAIEKHPNIAVASIWRHYSSAKDATIEVIRSGVPIIILISEFIPVHDVRAILVEARKYNTFLLGPNTPGIIFPPEHIKVGMLPDIFQAEEKNGKIGSGGVTLLSRSGAILYHLSDALASAGISQNAVLGVGGDSAIGSRFVDLVSLVSGFDGTDMVVIAGEIGGMQEELLAQHMQDNPAMYPKPVIALISGAHAPEGKTMGHAGAVVSPGQTFGTHISKRQALEKAGVVVVNHQFDLIKEVKAKLQKQYFDIEKYYNRMKLKWQAKKPPATWGTLITNVLPNNLLIHGYPLQDIVEKKGFLETAYLLSMGEFPGVDILKNLNAIAVKAAKIKGPETRFSYPDLSKTLGTYLQIDLEISSAKFDKETELVAFTLGRVARFFAMIFGNETTLDAVSDDAKFSKVIYSSLVGLSQSDKRKEKLLESMITACVDHGVTPPSTQTTILLATVRPPYEVAVAAGVQAITDVHGGAGQKAAEFFTSVVEKAKSESLDFEEATFTRIREVIMEGGRIEGLGHRIHTKDPRRDILWKMAEDAGYARDNVKISKIVSPAFYRVRGMNLPINVDGVIGAIVADMELKDPRLAKAIFVFGRVAGLSAHYFEEIQTQTEMRKFEFGNAVYKGKKLRNL